MKKNSIFDLLCKEENQNAMNNGNIVRVEEGSLLRCGINPDIVALPRSAEAGSEQNAIDRVLYYGLVESYAGKHCRTFSKSQDGRVMQSSEIRTPASTALIGLSEKERADAVTKAVSIYPKAIVHECAEESYIQIPIIRTSASSCGNIKDLFLLFADALDNTLLTDGCFRKKIVQDIVLWKMTATICDWIRSFHVGCWVIDGLGSFGISGKETYSLQELLTIAKQTGLFLFSTVDFNAMKKILRNPRLARGLMMRPIHLKDVLYEAEHNTKKEQEEGD